MSITTTKEAADEYFESRLDRDIWNAFDNDDLQERAIQTAIDALSQMLSDDITDDTVSTTANYYPDRAVFEQALFILINSDHTANGNLTGMKFPGASKRASKKGTTELQNVISPAAKAWLGIYPTPSMCRG